MTNPTAQTDTDDLVKRLRGPHIRKSWDHEAADLVEALTARVAELDGRVINHIRMHVYLRDDEWPPPVKVEVVCKGRSFWYDPSKDLNIILEKLAAALKRAEKAETRISALEAENARLLESLTAILDEPTLDDALQIARAALNTKPG